MKDNVRERILVKLLAAFVLLCIVGLTLLTVCVAEVEEGTTTIGDSGDILFYLIVAALVVAVIAICIIFRRSKKFVIKERERAAELSTASMTRNTSTSKTREKRRKRAQRTPRPTTKIKIVLKLFAAACQALRQVL